MARGFPTANDHKSTRLTTRRWSSRSFLGWPLRALLHARLYSWWQLVWRRRCRSSQRGFDGGGRLCEI